MKDVTHKADLNDAIQDIAFLGAEIARLREALSELVAINEQHNAAIAEVIGHPPGWNDSYLNKAREALGEQE